LPAGSRLRNLAELLAGNSQKWWTALIAFMNSEILTLAQYGIPEAEAYTLVSDELQIIFRRMFEIRMKMQQFSADRDKDLYYARCIWFTMKAHMVMQEFSDLNFATHVLISSLFVRFLAKQTGSNVASGIGSKLAQLRSDLNDTTEKVKKEAKRIDSRCDGLNTRLVSLEGKKK
jgi:hypothetical protein